MAGNSVTLTFAGDAGQLQRASQQADQAVTQVGSSVTTVGGDMERAGGSAADLSNRYGDLGSATTGAIDAVGSLAGGLQAVADIQDYARANAAKLERAQNDVEQAMADSRQAAIDLEQATQDLNQAYADGQQATLDASQADLDRRQAMIDATVAEKEYAAAVKEHGANSEEALQAEQDMMQATQDLRQAEADLTQANLDKTQAVTDAKQATEDGKQASIDARAAQLDLNDAMHEANPPELQQWADKLNLITPLLTAVIGVTSLVTAAQWAWNAAQLASPLTWLVLAIVAVIAVIVVIATKTDWFQRLWKAAWGGIKTAAAAVGSWFKDTLWGKWIKGAWQAIVDAGKSAWTWMAALPGKLKNAFVSVTGFLFAPFRAAFNRISDAWNSTIGRLHWTAPDWIPGIGGNTISVPNLPKFHAGGVVGRETLAVLQSGEKVSSVASRSGGEEWIRIDLGDLGDALVGAIAKSMATRHGGRIEALGVRVA